MNHALLVNIILSCMNNRHSSVHHHIFAAGTKHWSRWLFVRAAGSASVHTVITMQPDRTEGFFWRFESKIVTSLRSGMSSIGICCKEISTNLVVSWQNCKKNKFNDVIAIALKSNNTWRFWDHNANVSASKSSTLCSPQSFRPNAYGTIDPSRSKLAIATNNRISQRCEIKIMDDDRTLASLTLWLVGLWHLLSLTIIAKHDKNSMLLFWELHLSASSEFSLPISLKRSTKSHTSEFRA